MLNNREMAIEILQRAEAIGQRHNRRKKQIAAVSAFLCLALIVYLPRILAGNVSFTLETAGSAAEGAAIYASTMGGHMLVGVLAFVLGVIVTLFCKTRRK